MSLYAFNGTWNSEKTDVTTTAANEADENTNVLKFRAAHDSTNGFYTNGVGTKSVSSDKSLVERLEPVDSRDSPMLLGICARDLLPVTAK